MLQLFDGPAVLLRGIDPKPHRPGKTDAELLLLLPEDSCSVGPAHVPEVDAELLHRLVVGVLHEVVHHIIIGAVVVIEQFLHDREDHVGEAVLRELVPPLRVIPHLLDAAGDGGLDHGFFHQIGVQSVSSLKIRKSA